MLRVVAGIAGTYCRQADSEMFMVKRGMGQEQAPNPEDVF